MIWRFQLAGIAMVGAFMLVLAAYTSASTISASSPKWMPRSPSQKQSRTGQVSMRQSIAWIALLCVLSLAGCQTSANSCVGWQQISLKPDTAVYLAGNDTKAGKGIAAHNQFGKKQRCW